MWTLNLQVIEDLSEFVYTQNLKKDKQTLAHIKIAILIYLCDQ